MDIRIIDHYYVIRTAFDSDFIKLVQTFFSRKFREIQMIWHKVHIIFFLPVIFYRLLYKFSVLAGKIRFATVYLDFLETEIHSDFVSHSTDIIVSLIYSLSLIIIVTTCICVYSPCIFATCRV